LVDGVVHYGMANILGGVPRTSTFALSSAILPYVIDLARLKSVRGNWTHPALRGGLNVAGGRITHPSVGEALGVECTTLDEVL